MGGVGGVDAGRRGGVTCGREPIPYDSLIPAPGSRYSYFRPGAEGPLFAPGLKSLDDAATIRRKILLAFERAEAASDPALRERLMTFVLVGGGSTGVEMAGAIAELAKAALVRDFRHINPRAARILLVEAGPTKIGRAHV